MLYQLIVILIVELHLLNLHFLSLNYSSYLIHNVPVFIIQQSRTPQIVIKFINLDLPHSDQSPYQFVDLYPGS